MIFFFINL